MPKERVEMLVVGNAALVNDSVFCAGEINAAIASRKVKAETACLSRYDAIASASALASTLVRRRCSFLSLSLAVLILSSSPLATVSITDACAANALEVLILDSLEDDEIGAREALLDRPFCDSPIRGNRDDGFAPIAAAIDPLDLPHGVRMLSKSLHLLALEDRRVIIFTLQIKDCNISIIVSDGKEVWMQL
jgi:hypothetical protein